MPVLSSVPGKSQVFGNDKLGWSRPTNNSKGKGDWAGFYDVVPGKEINPDALRIFDLGEARVHEGWIGTVGNSAVVD